MNKKIIKLGETETEKQKFHQYEILFRQTM